MNQKVNNMSINRKNKIMGRNQIMSSRNLMMILKMHSLIRKWDLHRKEGSQMRKMKSQMRAKRGMRNRMIGLGTRKLFLINQKNRSKNKMILILWIKFWNKPTTTDFPRTQVNTKLIKNLKNKTPLKNPQSSMIITKSRQLQNTMTCLSRTSIFRAVCV